MPGQGSGAPPRSEGDPADVPPDVPADVAWAQRVADDPWPDLTGPLPPGILRLHGIVETPAEEQQLSLKLGHKGHVTIPLDADTWDVYEPVLTRQLVRTYDGLPLPTEVVATVVLEHGTDATRARPRVAAIASPYDLNRGAMSWPPRPLQPASIWGTVTTGPAVGHVPQFTAGYDQRILTGYDPSVGGGADLRLDLYEFDHDSQYEHWILQRALWAGLDQPARTQLADDCIARHPILHLLDDPARNKAVWNIRYWDADLSEPPAWHPAGVNVWRHLLEYIWALDMRITRGRPACVERVLAPLWHDPTSLELQGDPVKMIGMLEHHGATGLGMPPGTAWSGDWLAQIACILRLPIGDLAPWFEAGFIDPLASAYLYILRVDPEALVRTDPRWRQLLALAPGLVPRSYRTYQRTVENAPVPVPDTAMGSLAQAASKGLSLRQALASLPPASDGRSMLWHSWPPGEPGPVLKEVTHPLFQDVTPALELSVLPDWHVPDDRVIPDDQARDVPQDR